MWYYTGIKQIVRKGGIELAIVKQIKICKHCMLINKVCKWHILQYMILVDLVFNMDIQNMCMCKYTVHTSVIQ